MAASKDSRSGWAGPGSMKISVEPAQIITIRSTLVLVLERLDALADALEHGPLAAWSAMTLGPSRRFT